MYMLCRKSVFHKIYMYMKYNYHTTCDLMFGKGHFLQNNFDQINN